MPTHVEELIERAFEQASAKALEQIMQQKAEGLFQKAFAKGSPLAKKLEAKIGFKKG